MLNLSELKLGLRINLTTKEMSPYQKMERELSKFSGPQQPIYQIQNLPDTKDNDKEWRTVPIIPNKEPPLKTTI